MYTKKVKQFSCHESENGICRHSDDGAQVAPSEHRRWRWVDDDHTFTRGRPKLKIRKYSGNIDLDARTHVSVPCAVCVISRICGYNYMWRKTCASLCTVKYCAETFFLFFFFVDLWSGDGGGKNKWNRLAFLCTYRWGGVGTSIQHRGHRYSFFSFSDFVSLFFVRRHQTAKGCIDDDKVQKVRTNDPLFFFSFVLFVGSNHFFFPFPSFDSIRIPRRIRNQPAANHRMPNAPCHSLTLVTLCDPFSHLFRFSGCLKLFLGIFSQPI